MTRRDLSRETLIAAVVAAWDDIPARDKPALMLAHHDLYWTVARLAAAEGLRGSRR